MRFGRARPAEAEGLLWSRDSRIVSRIAQEVPHARIIELADSGWCVIGRANDLTEALSRSVAQASPYGLAEVDQSLPAAERYIVALGNAVRISGLGDRIRHGRDA